MQSSVNINIVAQVEIRAGSAGSNFACLFLMAYEDEIGLHRAIVKVVPYRPKWAEHFRKEKELLLKVMGEKVLDIRHIGSTSIVGMPAKPILDVLVGLQTLAAVEPFVEDLNLIGYEDRGNGDDLGRRYFVKGAEEKRTHHLNFCELNGSFWTTHILFRDYLEKHPDAAKGYAALKRALADRFPNNRKAYTDGKEEFVRLVLNLAMNERIRLLELSPPSFPEINQKR
jgi:GrpB-like predicted nucleotidyltransferase (UPF0157 family)